MAFAYGSLDEIGSLAGQFLHVVMSAVDEIDVIASAAVQCVVPGIAGDGIVARSSLGDFDGSGEIDADIIDISSDGRPVAGP